MFLKRNEERNYFHAILSASVLFLILCSINAFADSIIDNGDPDTFFTGTWNVSGAADPWDPDDPSATSLWSRDGATYTWTFRPTDSGYHNFFLWWTEWHSRSNSVPVTISHWGGTDTLSINQQEDGGQWNFQEAYPFEAGVSYDITMTSVPGGTQNYSSSADAVQFVYLPELNVLPVATIDSISPNPALTDALITFTGHGDDIDGSITGWSWDSNRDGHLGDSATFTTLSPLSPGTHTISFTVVDDTIEESEPVIQTLIVQDTINEVIIDNGDLNTSFAGSWSVSGGPDPWDPADSTPTSLYSKDGDTYTWTFTPPISGGYEFSMWWTEWASRSPNIPVSIEFSGGTDTVSIDQQSNGGMWNSLGSYPFVAGNSYDITITAVPRGTQNYSTCADAVRLVYTGDINQLPVATIEDISLKVAAPGDQIIFEGSGFDNDGTVIGFEWRSDIDGILSDQDTFSTNDLLSPLSPGTHTIFFRVQDDQSIWSKDAVALVIVRDCNSPVAIMQLGNSITNGVGEISEVGLRTGFRQPLFQALKNADYFVDFVGDRSTGIFVVPPFDIDHQGVPGIEANEVSGDVYNWLVAHPAEIVLLHIGTNDPTTNPDAVEDILNEIDRYEDNQGVEITVVLARIINRQTSSPGTTIFNNNVQTMAEARIVAGDKIVIVDQESALNYATDMWDNLHPNNAGYNKMDDVWIDALVDLLPVCSDFEPFIFTSPITEATIGYPYTSYVGALGDPAPSYNLLVGPVGMSLDPTTGEISWTPASGQEGVHEITVQAENVSGIDTQDFSIDASGSIIIDNDDLETSFTGSWSISSGPDPWDPADSTPTSRWSRDGDTYTWTFTPLVSGEYEVSMWWTQFSSRSNNVPVLIEFSGGTDTVTIDQQTDGGQWNILNAYLFVAGQDYDITITSQPGPTSTSADAVKFALLSATPPSITSHPSNQTVTEGETTTFSVAATGSAPLSYQWQKNGSVISDATGATYTTPASILSDNGALFRCVVTNVAGSATSDAATLTVNAAVAPSITSHPSNQTGFEGETATFSVTATGSAPLSYQWQKNGSDISGATGATYTTPASILSDNGALFRCVVTNVAGSATSDAATLTVNAAVAPSITSHPSNQTVLEGETAIFSVAVTGSAPLSYQWQKNGSDISGATGATYTTPASILSDNGALFRCMVTNIAGNATSDAATLTVNEIIVAPSITSHPSNQTVLEGETATFSVTATGSTPLSYQWQKNEVDISGATGDMYTTPATVLGDDGTLFRCVVTNIAGTVMSNAATLTIVISEAPIAFNDKSETMTGVPVTIIVVANDSDSDGTIDPATVSLTSSPGNGTAVEQGDGTVLYTPDLGYSGKVTFMYTVQDDQGVVSNTASVTVTVGIVIDNGDPQTSYTGNWSVSGGPDPFDDRIDPGATSFWSRDGDTYTWTFSPDVSGKYQISMWHTYLSSRSENIPVDIVNWNGTDTIYINQQANGGEWNILGSYPFVAGESYDITITAVPGGTENFSTCADAVRFVHIPGNVAPIAMIDSISPTQALPGQTVTFSGSGIDFEGTIEGYKWYSTLDGPLSDQATFSSSTLSEGVHTILFSVQDNNDAWSSEIQASVDVNDYTVETTEHIFMASGYATSDGTPVIISALRDIGATENGDVWQYKNTARNKRYIVHLPNTEQEFIDGLMYPDAIVGYFGHSNYGLGQLFANAQETRTQVIDDILYVDDDRIVNLSSPVVHVNVSGMRTGQAYPYWWPTYQDDTSAVMPYDFGDPNGDPVYNYYPTYRVPGDPTYYKIETVRHSAIVRFPDWYGGPAWYDPNGEVPDPTNNPDDLQYYITNPEPWSPSYQRYGDWVSTNILVEPGTLEDYYREDYEYSTAGSGTDQAEWLFSIPEEGDYNVFTWYHASSTNSNHSPFTVNHSLGSTTVPINQRLNGGQWNKLEEFHFDAGDYSVVLTDNVSSGRVVADGIRIEHVDNPPEILKADFHARTLSGPAPLEVYFDSENVGDIDTFEWDFGNGVKNSTRSSQWVIYTDPGTYTVTYTINGPLGSDTTTEVDYIIVGDVEPPLKAEFESRSSQKGTAPFDARFRDRSSGDIVSWEWDLDGDGDIDSTDEDPEITYTEPGVYTVTLTVKDINADTDTETKVNYVRVIVFDKNIDNVDYPKRHYGSKTLLGVKDQDAPKEDFKYARLFYGGCDSAHYFTQTFQRGIYHYASGSTYDGEFAMADYLKGIVGGKSDYEIWQTIQAIEPKYDYYDFTKPPSEQW